MSRAAAAAVFAAGLLLASVGGGLGVPYLQKVGWSAEAVLGLTAMVVGLGLAAFGTIVLVRSVRGVGRVGMVLLVALVAYAVVPSVAVAVAATHVPRTTLADVTPADLGLDYTDATFRTPDGVRLSGWYVPSTNGDAVALLHGAGSTRTAVVEHARALAELGYGVLLFDARGHGRSGGRAMDLGWNGDADLAGAVRYLRARPDVAGGRVLAVGLSMGGEEAIGALPAIPGLCGVVAEGATGRTASDQSWLSDAYGIRGLFQEGMDRLKFGLTDLLTSASSPRSLRSAVAGAGTRHVLLIAAGREPDEEHAARYIAGGAPGRVDVWVAPGAGHVGVFDARRAEWVQRVGDFLASAPC